ncbi:hypothetical protein [Kitasatospora cheerisanensis]|uniref:Uncharacterized protein n=1 Tax=Kitasatospora cheerisanensis KCTC 2395 TaxID=1348663 RepID=A0A066YVM3_9ACTN|nr:hypothetical protein [Kitasatospora cheerisanensis]KDN85593.1 hypothetical protein KCH_26100 [Kitasatospora cheerisanensis KCTC 2395]
MPRRLAFAVHLDHPVTGDHLILLPGDVPPEELAELITHPGAWQSADDEDPPDPGPDADDHGPEPGGQAASTDDGTPPAKPTTRTRKPRSDAD